MLCITRGRVTEPVDDITRGRVTEPVDDITRGRVTEPVDDITRGRVTEPWTIFFTSLHNNVHSMNTKLLST